VGRAVPARRRDRSLRAVRSLTSARRRTDRAGIALFETGARRALAVPCAGTGTCRSNDAGLRGPSRVARRDLCARLFDDTIESAGPSRVARLRPGREDRRQFSSSRATSGGAWAALGAAGELTPFAPLALRATLLLEVGGRVPARESVVPRDASEISHAARQAQLVPRDASEVSHAARQAQLVPRDASEVSRRTAGAAGATRCFRDLARRTAPAARTPRRHRRLARDARSASRTARKSSCCSAPPSPRTRCAQREPNGS